MSKDLWCRQSITVKNKANKTTDNQSLRLTWQWGLPWELNHYSASLLILTHREWLSTELSTSDDREVAVCFLFWMCFANFEFHFCEIPKRGTVRIGDSTVQHALQTCLHHGILIAEGKMPGTAMVGILPILVLCTTMLWFTAPACAQTQEGMWCSLNVIALLLLILDNNFQFVCLWLFVYVCVLPGLSEWPVFLVSIYLLMYLRNIMGTWHHQVTKPVDGVEPVRSTCRLQSVS